MKRSIIRMLARASLTLVVATALMPRRASADSPPSPPVPAWVFMNVALDLPPPPAVPPPPPVPPVPPPPPPPARPMPPPPVPPLPPNVGPVPPTPPMPPFERGSEHSGPVNETRPAKANGAIDIDVPNGEVKIIAWNKNEVNVKGHVDRAELEVSSSEGRTRVRVAGRRHQGWEADLEIRVPAASRIEARGVSTTIEVRDVSGALRLQSVSGDINVTGSPSDVDVHSVNGQVDLTVKSAVVNARSISGEVRVSGARGRAMIDSVSGNCSLIGGDFTEVEMRSVSGELNFTGALSGQGSFEFKTHSGDIELRVPQATNADVELRTFNGSLESRLGAGAPKQSNSALDFRVGNGGAKVRGRTFNGDIRVEAKVDTKK